MGIIAKGVFAPAHNADIPVLAFRYNNWRVIINKKEINVKEIDREADAVEVLNYLKDIVEKGNTEAGKWGLTDMTEEQQFKAGVNTHENVIFTCYGGASNTGITSGLAALEAVKELGLKKAAIMCLAGLPTNVKTVLGKTRAAKKIITVDGCPFECSRKIVEQAGFKPTKSIVLTRDIAMKKKGLSEDIGGDIKGVMDYISDDEVKKAKELIVKSIQEE